MKYIVFSPYFGKLPIHFQLWLESCKFNTDFKFVVFTNDNRKFDAPDNVELINMSQEQFVRRIQEKFDFPVNILNPYKLCDCKPIYGYVFNDMADGFDYWGHCDLDLVFGNLGKFLPKEEYEKINHAAHMTLYKNTKEINEAFLDETNPKNFKKIIANENYLGFDELGDYCINAILKRKGYRVYPYEMSVAGIDCLHHNFNITATYDVATNKTTGYDTHTRIMSFENGAIYSYSIVDGDIQKKEYAYTHFQKRSMENKVTDYTANFIICPHSFEDYPEVIDEQYILSKKVDGFYKKAIDIKIAAGKRKIKRILALRKMSR